MHRFALVLILVLSACATADTVPTAVYRCAGGERLDVVFEENQAVVTTKNGTMATLQQQKAASGIWYSNDRYDLRGKGKYATWTIGRRAPINCRAK